MIASTIEPSMLVGYGLLFVAALGVAAAWLAPLIAELRA